MSLCILPDSISLFLGPALPAIGSTALGRGCRWHSSKHVTVIWAHPKQQPKYVTGIRVETKMSLKCSVCFLHRRLVLFLLRCQWRSWNILQWSLPKQKTKPNDNITMHTHLDDWSASLPFDCSWADNRTKDDKIWQWQNGLILQEQNPDETFLDTFPPPSCYFFHVFHTTFCMHNNPKKTRHTAITKCVTSPHQLHTVQSIDHVQVLLPQEVVEGTKDHVLDVLSYIKIDLKKNSIFYLVSKHVQNNPISKKYLKLKAKKWKANMVYDWHHMINLKENELSDVSSVVLFDPSHLLLK